LVVALVALPSVVALVALVAFPSVVALVVSPPAVALVSVVPAAPSAALEDEVPLFVALLFPVEIGIELPSITISYNLLLIPPPEVDEPFYEAAGVTLAD